MAQPPDISDTFVREVDENLRRDQLQDFFKAYGSWLIVAVVLFLAASAAGAGLPWYAILCLPVLFAAGMSLLDTIDGSFMNFAYGWAFSKPVRKVYYNITITGLSVAVALLIGTAELFSVLSDKLGLTGGFWTWVDGLDLNTIGYGIVAVTTPACRL